MSTDVVVGVRKLTADGSPIDDGDEAKAEIQCHWVQVGDALITAADHHLLGVSYKADDGFSEVTIRLCPGSFTTVAHDARPSA